MPDGLTRLMGTSAATTFGRVAISPVVPEVTALPAQPAPEESPTAPSRASSFVSPTVSLASRFANLDPRLVIDRIVPPIQDPFIARGQGAQMWTRLANSAIEILSGSARDVLDGAIITLGNINIPPDQALKKIENARGSYDEKLAELAEGWSQESKAGFAEEFRMPVEQLKVMDAIVSIGILNSPNLEQLLRRENMQPATISDLLEKRKIVWQYPEPGTPMEPPYVILLAVEHIDTGAVRDVVEVILGELVPYQRLTQRFRLPKAAVQKLG